MDENRKSHELGELAKALVAFHSECPEIRMDSDNPFFKSRYASLHAILAAARPVLTKHGLAVAQTMFGDYVETLLLHTSGQWLAGSTPIRAKDGTNPQSVGSAITYARRYGLAAILSLAADPDDDANGATDNWKENTQAGKVAAAIESAIPTGESLKYRKPKKDDI